MKVRDARDGVMAEDDLIRDVDLTAMRRHPDLFTAEEAIVYLHLDGERALRTLRDDYGLVGHPGVGKGFMYWREDLDRAALRIVGRDREWKAVAHKMRISG